MEMSATFSECKRFRYTLVREWDEIKFPADANGIRMNKKLLSQEANKSFGTIPSRLKQIVCQMETDDYSKSDAAVLITRDKATGIVSIVHMTENGIYDMRTLFDEAARIYGYARVN